MFSFATATDLIPRWLDATVAPTFRPPFPPRETSSGSSSWVTTALTRLGSWRPWRTWSQSADRTPSWMSPTRQWWDISLAGKYISSPTKTCFLQIQIQSLSSPNFPSNYPTNVRCQWILTADNYERIKLNFVDISIVSNRAGCAEDYVLIEDVNDGVSPISVAEIFHGLDLVTNGLFSSDSYQPRRGEFVLDCELVSKLRIWLPLGSCKYPSCVRA